MTTYSSEFLPSTHYFGMGTTFLHLVAWAQLKTDMHSYYIRTYAYIHTYIHIYIHTYVHA